MFFITAEKFFRKWDIDYVCSWLRQDLLEECKILRKLKRQVRDADAVVVTTASNVRGLPKLDYLTRVRYLTRSKKSLN